MFHCSAIETNYYLLFGSQNCPLRHDSFANVPRHRASSHYI